MAGRARRVLAFLLGLLLAFMTFPLAWSVSALAGYAAGILALAIAAWLWTSRRGGLDAVLAVVLGALALISLAVTAIVHIGAFTLEEALKQVTETKHVEAALGQTLHIDGLDIVVRALREANCIRVGSSVYAAHPGKKLVLVLLRVANTGNETISLPTTITSYNLITTSNRSYEDKDPAELEWVLGEKPNCTPASIEPLDTAATVPPHATIRGYLVFEIPADERPKALHLKVWSHRSYEATIYLTRTPRK